MKTKMTFMALAGLMLIGGMCAYIFMNSGSEDVRTPASLPENYEAMGACEKQELLWQRVQSSVHGELPEYKELGLMQLLAMARQELSIKGDRYSDFAPNGWKKYLHARGALAKVKIVPVPNKYSGIFQGAECALLRLSLTYKTKGNKPVAPGLALKVLRDGTYSANVSALVSLNGQEKDFNFFKYPMSNIIPVGSGVGQKIVHKIFGRVTGYPEELLASDMAVIDVHGEKIKSVVAPRQIFFVPGSELKFSSNEHDVRDDFRSIPENTVIYKIYSLSDQYATFDYSTYSSEQARDFVKDSIHVADIVTTSEFVASEFGDSGIFFRHQLRP
jgi:hypothetical protein